MLQVNPDMRIERYIVNMTIKIAPNKKAAKYQRRLLYLKYLTE